MAILVYLRRLFCRHKSVMPMYGPKRIWLHCYDCGHDLPAWDWSTTERNSE